MRLVDSSRNSLSAETQNNKMNTSASQPNVNSTSSLENNVDLNAKSKSLSHEGIVRKNVAKLRPELQDFFHIEPSLYSQQVFDHAAKIFDVLKHESREEDPFLRMQQEKALLRRKELMVTIWWNGSLLIRF